MSELLKTVESFVDDFVPTDSVNDDELMKYRDHGWVCELKNFNSIFEEMAKASNRLHQNGVDAIQTLEEELQKLTHELEDRTLMTDEVEKEIEEMRKICEKLKSDIIEQRKEEKALKKLDRDYSDDVDRATTIIGKQNKLLFLITRLTWDQKMMKTNLIKGFVTKKDGKDVSVFETDPQKTNNRTIVSDLLWDYISA